MTPGMPDGGGPVVGPHPGAGRGPVKRVAMGAGGAEHRGDEPGHVDVAFVVMPFADVGRPALGVSLLQAEIEPLGLSSRVYYFNLDLAATLGLDLYARLAQSMASEALLGEWFFADLLFGDRIPDERAYVTKVLGQYVGLGTFVRDVLAARRYRRAFVERCVDTLRQARPRVVGFTTTFHQTCASLAVALRLKQASDPPVIVFGGANCEGEMGRQLIRSCPWIDYVCTGEGDVAFPLWMEQWLRLGDPVAVPGMVGHDAGDEPANPAPVRDLDRLPIPRFGDYFQHARNSPLCDQIEPWLVIETSRGCWWGEKHHCTFCGLNGETMAFRSKSAERVLRELTGQATTFGCTRMECVDNILDLRYLRTLFPLLIERGPRLDLFYETKANLKWSQVAVLAAGGVRVIQPGIESLSSEVLRLMRKGCTAAQNIQLLRWCEELGMRVAWNILFGFPGESPREYERMAALVPLLTHLQPPVVCAPFRLDRFSPYFSAPAEFGLARIRPNFAYYYVFPFGRGDLARLAYYFEFDRLDGSDPSSYTGALQREVQRWSALHQQRDQPPPRLDQHWEGDALSITDTRPAAVRTTHRLEGIAAILYRMCDAGKPFARLREALGERADEGAIRATLEGLMAAKLLLDCDGHYLALAVLRDRSPAEKDERPRAELQLA